MPAYNEAATVGIAVKRVLDIRYPCDVEVVVVNDGSADNTSEVLASIDDPRVTIAEHPVNRGKGAAVRTAAAPGHRRLPAGLRCGPGVLRRTTSSACSLP